MGYLIMPNLIDLSSKMAHNQANAMDQDIKCGYNDSHGYTIFIAFLSSLYVAID